MFIRILVMEFGDKVGDSVGLLQMHGMAGAADHFQTGRAGHPVAIGRAMRGGTMRSCSPQITSDGIDAR
jgi:hypothetical protein